MAALIEIPGDKRRFLAGMQWSTHERRPSRKKMLEIASTEGNWVSERRGQSIIQSGYCEPVDGIKNPKGIFSIAAMIAESKPEPWLGIFDLGNGLYWYIAVRDNNGILPFGDVIGSYDEVSTARSNAAGLGYWNYVDGGLEDLAYLLRTASPSVRVVNISKRPWIAPVLTVSILAGISIGGWWMWNNHEAEVAHQRALDMARERAMIAAMQAKNKKKVILPWTRQPSPSAFMNTCGSLLGHLPISDYGWLLSSIGCHTEGLQVSAKANWVIGPGATAQNIPQGLLSNTGKKVSGKPQVSHPLTMDDDTYVSNPQSAIRSLYAVTQPMGIKVSLSVPRHTAPVGLPGSKPNAKIKVVNPWQTIRVVMNTEFSVLSVDGLGQSLDRVHGLRLVSMVGKGVGKWKLYGDLYVSRFPQMPIKPTYVNNVGIKR